MSRTYISHLKDKIQQKAVINGWAHNIRNKGGIKFLQIRDNTGIIQVVITKDNEEACRVVDSLSFESVVEIEGVVQEVPKSDAGCEILADKITILSLAAPELPILVNIKSDNEAAQDMRLDYRWLDLRRPEKLLIFKIWTTMEAAFREYFLQNNFIEIHSPKLMNAASEGGASVFEVKYFDRKAYLAQSPQFYKQMAMSAGFERVFEFGPVFRAEESNTIRHCTEFSGIDAEMSFIQSHLDVMKEIENMFVHVMKSIKEKHEKEIQGFYNVPVTVPATPFPQITIKEAKDILKKKGIPSEKYGDMGTEEEREIGKYMQEKEGHEFVFITDYPAEFRAFYHMRKEDDPSLAKGADLLFKGVEIITTAQREHRYEKLLEQCKERGIDPDTLEPYLSYFKYGCPPHGGFGLGPARVIMQLLNLPNIREASYLHRGVTRLTP